MILALTMFLAGIFIGSAIVASTMPLMSFVSMDGKSMSRANDAPDDVVYLFY